MKRTTVIMFSVLAVLTTVSGAMAQGGVFRATIPFAFIVENRSLPAGTYEITRSLGDAIRIQNILDPHITTSAMTLRDNTESRDESVLIFEKYGNRYFLHGVFAPGVMNVSLFLSKEEKQIRQQTGLPKFNDTSRVPIGRSSQVSHDCSRKDPL